MPFASIFHDISMVDDTDASSSTRTGTKSYITSLNNHLNITNTMVSLMVPSAPCDRKLVIAMYVLNTNMPLKCHT